MDDKKEDFIPLREVAKLFGLKPTTIRSWANKGKIDFIKTPSGQRLFPRSQFKTYSGFLPTYEKKKKIIYCRVSSKKQSNDLERQINFLQSKYPNYQLITDIGSGINWKRKGLLSILELAMSGHIGELLVAHKDRLARFGYELIEFIIKSSGGKITILDETEHKSNEQELAEDLLSIVHVYSCRQMGRRRYSQSQKDKVVS